MLTALRAAVVQRAEEGVPIDAVLRAHHLGVQVAWDHLVAFAEPSDLAGVIEVSRLQLRYLRDVTAVVSGVYGQERQAVFGEEHGSRQALLSALLDDGPAAEPPPRRGSGSPRPTSSWRCGSARIPTNAAPV